MNKEFKDAEEYYRQTRLVETKNWSLQMALNFADEYHQAKLKLLGIADVVGQSEQLFCVCKRPVQWTTDEGFIGCVKCNKEIKKK